jgi:hypothetical protein
MGEARKARQKNPAEQRAQPIKQRPELHPTPARKNPLKKKLRGVFICAVA